MCCNTFIMNIQVTIILINCSLILSAFINDAEIPEGKIVGGHEAAPHSYPYLVSLQMRLWWMRVPICSGTILNERWVLTAAHCITESWTIRWLHMDAVAGAHNIYSFGPSTQISQIEKRIPHPKYSGGIAPYDIAVLLVQTPFKLTKEIKPIQLPYDDAYSRHKDLMLPGWGVLKTTIFIPDLPTRLHEVQVTYVPFDECHKAIDDLSEPGEINELDKEANLCTGPLDGGVAACNGDSGGPLVEFISYDDTDSVEETTLYYDDDIDDSSENKTEINTVKSERSKQDGKDKEIVVIGIVSWGVSPCGKKGAPTVYTNVSHYMDFITQNIY